MLSVLNDLVLHRGSRLRSLTMVVARLRGTVPVYGTRWEWATSSSSANVTGPLTCLMRLAVPRRPLAGHDSAREPVAPSGFAAGWPFSGRRP